MKEILLLNGPNLNMLGTREPNIYGKADLNCLIETVTAYSAKKGASVVPRQSNHEGQLIDWIQEAHEAFDGIIFNPGAYTHYSYALRDALAGTDTPCVEVHLSDVSQREPFRSISVTAPVCVARVKGRGFQGYCDAVDILLSGACTRLGENFEERLGRGQIVIGGVGLAGARA